MVDVQYFSALYFRREIVVRNILETIVKTPQPSSGVIEEQGSLVRFYGRDGTLGDGIRLFLVVLLIFLQMLSKPQHYPKNIVFYSVNHSVIG